MSDRQESGPNPQTNWQQAFDELQARQSELEQRLQRLEGRQRAQAQRPARAPAPQLEKLIGLHGFSWLGILALVTGLGFFIRFAYLEGWLGPLAILAAGALVGLAMLLSGEWVGRKELYRTWAHALMGGGIAVWYFLAYAAYHFSYFRQVTQLNLFSDTLLLIGVVALAIVLALRRQSQSLASRAFLIGFATSLFSKELVGLTLIYNLLLNLGLVGVVSVCNWPHLALVGILGAYLLHGLWIFANPELALNAQVVLLVYFALYSLVSLRLEFQSSPRQVSQTAKTLSLEFAQNKAWLAASNLLGYGVLALLLQDKLTTWQALSSTLLWFGLGLAQQFWLLPRGASRGWQAVFAAHWAVAALFCHLIAESGWHPAKHIQSAFLACWILSSMLWSFWAGRQQAELQQGLNQALSTLCLTGLLALEVPASWLSISWSIAGCTLIIAGFAIKHRLLRLQGQLLLLCTGLKVFLLDLNSLSMGWKILSLLVLGGLLLGISLIYTHQNKTHQNKGSETKPES